MIVSLMINLFILFLCYCFMIIYLFMIKVENI
jgi:hypothetical protein